MSKSEDGEVLDFGCTEPSESPVNVHSGSDHQVKNIVKNWWGSWGDSVWVNTAIGAQD